MISCRKARVRLVEATRGALGEAGSLELDLHLSSCAACRVERARWETVGALRDFQPPALRSDASTRFAAKLAAHRASAPPRREVLVTRWTVGLVAVAGAAGLMLWLRTGAPRPASPGPVAAATAGPQRWERPARVVFADAEVAVRAGTVADLRTAARTVALTSGELDLRRRRAGAPLRVVTPGFAVLVHEAHVVVASDRVQVLEGEIQVFTPDERLLAVVHAQERWPAPAPVATPPPVAPPGVPATPSPPPAPPPVPPVNHAPARREPSSGSSELDHARAALADGDAATARRLLRVLFDGPAAASERAEAELLLAEAFLTERDTDRALASFRKTAAAYPRLPAGEEAAFAAAQLLFEQGRGAEAKAAGRAYLSRYPGGRFAREVRERLAQIPDEP